MPQNYTQLRLRMVQDQITRRGIKDKRIINAFNHIPRHLFVSKEQIHAAYEDHPLAIGYNQTISQPYMVAYMLEALELKGGERVLEIGTGSGYQTALLSKLVKSVYTIERISGLLDLSKSNLKSVNQANIFFKIADGTLGWSDESPFDRIIVSAGSPSLGQTLVDQLADKGIMIIPVGDRYSQELLRIRKKDGNIEKKTLTRCVFVKLIGKEGWKDE